MIVDPLAFWQAAIEGAAAGQTATQVCARFDISPFRLPAVWKAVEKSGAATRPQIDDVRHQFVTNAKRINSARLYATQDRSKPKPPSPADPETAWARKLRGATFADAAVPDFKTPTRFNAPMRATVQPYREASS